MYGKDESVESISIGLFDNKKNSYYSTSKNGALNYCINVNDLELKDNNWIYSTIIDENEKILLLKPSMFEMINNLHDFSIQKLLRETEKTDWAKALIDADNKIKEKIFKNMTKISAVMLKEDMESLHEISAKDIKLSRIKIIQTIQRLSATGEIIVAREG
jgi:DNA-directed RNA polymerase beta' subunit